MKLKEQEKKSCVLSSKLARFLVNFQTKNAMMPMRARPPATDIPTMAPVPIAGLSSSSSLLVVADAEGEEVVEVPVWVTTTVATSPSASVVRNVEVPGGGGFGLEGVVSGGGVLVVEVVLVVDSVVSVGVVSEVVVVVEEEEEEDVVVVVVEVGGGVVAADVVVVVEESCLGMLEATATWQSASARRQVARRRMGAGVVETAVNAGVDSDEEGRALWAKYPRWLCVHGHHYHQTLPRPFHAVTPSGFLNSLKTRAKVMDVPIQRVPLHI
jgi:hypothetical protein